MLLGQALLKPEDLLYRSCKGGLRPNVSYFDYLLLTIQVGAGGQVNLAEEINIGAIFGNV